MEIKNRGFMNLNSTIKKRDTETHKNLKENQKLEIKGSDLKQEQVIEAKENALNETNLKHSEEKVTRIVDRSEEKNEKVKEAIDILNKLLKKKNAKIEFESHDFFKNDLMIKIVDEDTGNIIVEVPPKKILDMIASLVEMAEGIVIDKKA